jgi:ankyrin repeat protein
MIWFQKTEEVVLLLKLGADPNVQTTFNFLYFAVEQEQVAIVTLLLEYGIDSNKGRPLEAAVRKGNINLINVLLKHGADIKKSLKIAIEMCNLTIIELLLSYGTHLNSKLNIDHLIDDNRIDIIQLLLRYNYTFSCKTLNYAIVESKEPIVKLLLDSGLPFSDKKGNNALIRACSINNLNMVRLILNYNFDVNATNAKGRSALFFTDDEAILTFLVKKGADLNLQDYRGNTALYDAVKYKMYHLTQILLSLGADPSIKNHRGWTVNDKIDHWNDKWSEPEFSDDESAESKFKNLIASCDICIKEVGYD